MTVPATFAARTAPAGATAADPMRPMPLAVLASRQETHDVVTLDIARPPGLDGAAFAPGQFNMLYVFGVGEVAISLSGDPGDPGPLRHTVRGVGAVSRAIVGLGPGGTIGVRGPFGSAWPMAEAEGRDVVVVAGGLGLAPLRPALYRLMATRERYRRVILLYGTRSPADILFGEELGTWRDRGLEVEVTIDHAAGAWDGNVGVVTRLIPRVAFDAGDAIGLVCGPEVMMRFTLDALVERGIDPSRLYLSAERNMKCAVAQCGHCQFGPDFVCKDGPVFRHDRVRHRLTVREI
ncbi:MAG: FAD/NAD(P)-binding protein [Azospirillaceae bacterium]